MGVHKLIAKIVTVLLFGLLILSFAVWGIGDIFRGGGQSQSIAEVGEVSVDQQSFAVAFNRQLNSLSRQFGSRIEVEQAIQLGLDREVLRNLINRALLQADMQRQGLVVSDTQLRRMIAENASFQDSLGAFDAGRFRQALSNLGMSEQTFLQNLTSETIAGQLAGALSDAVMPPEKLAETVYAYENERRIASYIQLATPNSEDIAEPETDVLEQFFMENKANFQAPAYRSVTFVHLDTAELAKEIVISDEKVLAAFEANKEALSTAEQRTVEQILFTTEDDAAAAFALLQGGKNFATVAEELSGSAPVGLGTSDGAGLLPALREAAFAISESGGVSPPTESPLGWHLLHVTEILPAKEAQLADHKEALRAQLAEYEAVDSIIALANALNDELGAGSDLESAAATLGLSPRTINGIDRQGRGRDGEPVENLPQGFGAFIFEEEIGETGVLKEDGSGGYFVSRVESSEDPKLRAFADVRGDVLTLWRQAEVVTQLREQATALVDRIKAGESLEDIADELALPLQASTPLRRGDSDPALSSSPQFARNIFQLAEKETVSVPIGGSFIVARLDVVLPADKAADSEGLEETKELLRQSLRADLFDLYMATVQSEVGVSVNETVLNNTLRSSY